MTVRSYTFTGQKGGDTGSFIWSLEIFNNIGSAPLRNICVF